MTALRDLTNTQEYKKGHRMNKRVFMVMVIICSANVLADEMIKHAIDDVLRFSCLADRSTALSVPGWGVPDELLVEPTFTSLVEVVRARIDRCDVPFLCGMTNDVRREVFIAALARCGASTYRDAIVMWFGGNIPPATSARMVEQYVDPATTRMEGYSIEHYDDPGISNVWLNLKSLYLSEGNVVEANVIDEILSGESKADREAMKKAYNCPYLAP